MRRRTGATQKDVSPVTLLRAAAEMARRLDDRHALLYVLQFGTHLGTFLPEGEGFAVTEEVLGLARALGQPLALISAAVRFPSPVSWFVRLGTFRQLPFSSRTKHSPPARYWPGMGAPIASRGV
jgi:hypothetical protein